MAFEKSLTGRLRELRIRNTDDDVRYVATYQVFIKYFGNHVACDDLFENDAKAAVVLVYSWMKPAKLRVESLSNFALVRDALLRCKTGEIAEADLDMIRSFVGGSLIATSKFLHFFKPECFAMWDRHVAWAAYRYRLQYKNSDTRKYLEYLKDLPGLELSKRVGNRIDAVLGDVSALRRKEFALFQLGISESK